MAPRVELYTAYEPGLQQLSNQHRPEELSPVQEKIKQANQSGKYGPVPKRCVVTGGLGFVGQRLVETLVERGAEQEGSEVVSFDIVPPAANVCQNKAIKYVTADLCDFDAVLQAVEGADCVWHNAAAVGPFLPKHFYKNVNVIGTRNVLEACKKQGDGIELQDRYVAEYSATKAEGELLLRKACKEGEILFIAVAPHTVYGPRDNLFLPNLLEAAGIGKLRVFGSGKSRVGYTHVDNYCHGLVIAEKQLYKESPHLGKFYVCTDGATHPHPEAQGVRLQETSRLASLQGYSVFWEELDQAVTGMGFDSLYSKMALPYFLLRIVAFICDTITAFTGKKLKLGWFTLRMLTMHRWFRITAAQTDLGYQPVVSYKEGWPDTIEWFRTALILKGALNKWLPTFDPKTASGTTGSIAQQTVDKVKLQEQKMQKHHDLPRSLSAGTLCRSRHVEQNITKDSRAADLGGQVKDLRLDVTELLTLKVKPRLVALERDASEMRRRFLALPTGIAGEAGGRRGVPDDSDKAQKSIQEMGEALLDRARREMQRQEEVVQSHAAKFHCIEASLDAASRELTTEAHSTMQLAERKAEALASAVAEKVGRSAAEEQLDQALVTFREELSQMRGGTTEASQTSSLLRAELSEAKTSFGEADAQLCDQIDVLRGSLTEANGALRVQVEEAKAATASSREATGCLRHDVEAVSSEVRTTQQEVQSLKRGSQEANAAVREGFAKVQTLSAEAIAGLRQQLAETKTDLAEAEKNLQMEHAKVLKFAGHAEFEAQTAAQQTSRLAAGLRGVEETLERRMQWVAASSNELEASVAHAFAESHSALARTSRALATEVVAERCRSAQVEEDVVSRLRRFEDAVSGDSRSQADAVEQLNQAIAVAALRRQGEERNLLKKVHDSLRSVEERHPLERRELVEAVGRAVAEAGCADSPQGWQDTSVKQVGGTWLEGVVGLGVVSLRRLLGPHSSPRPVMARRIDGLYCTAETADEVVRRVIAETHNEAEKVRNEVAAAVSERIQALQARQQELLNQIDFMVQSKVQTLENQLQEIQGQVCPFAPNQEDCYPLSHRGISSVQDPDGAPMEGVFLLRADAVVRFRLGDTDFGEKIPEWGQVGEKSTYASMSFAKGPGLGVLKVNNPSFLWVFACDRDGARRTEGGDRVVATLSHPEETGLVTPGHDFQDVAVEDLQDGRYKVTFLPLTPGSFSLQISIGPEGADEDLTGCPFTLEVRPPTVYHTIGIDGEVEGKAQLGHPG
eukprot:s2123_g2.t1